MNSAGKNLNSNITLGQVHKRKEALKHFYNVHWIELVDRSLDILGLNRLAPWMGGGVWISVKGWAGEAFLVGLVLIDIFSYEEGKWKESA